MNDHISMFRAPHVGEIAISTQGGIRRTPAAIIGGLAVHGDGYGPALAVTHLRTGLKVATFSSLLGAISACEDLDSPQARAALATSDTGATKAALLRAGIQDACARHGGQIGGAIPRAESGVGP